MYKNTKTNRSKNAQKTITLYGESNQSIKSIKKKSKTISMYTPT